MRNKIVKQSALVCMHFFDYFFVQVLIVNFSFYFLVNFNV